MNTVLTFDWKTDGDYKMISWALYTTNDELIEEGDYKVWRFKDLVGNSNSSDIEDGFDVEYVTTQLDKIIKKYKPTLQPSSDRCWKEFCEYSGLKTTIEKQEGITERLKKQDKFKSVAGKSVEDQFVRFGGNKLTIKLPAQQIYFIYQKMEKIGEFPTDVSYYSKLNEQYKAVVEKSNENTFVSPTKREEWEPLWLLVIVGAVLVFVGGTMVVSSAAILLGILFIGLGSWMTIHNLFRWR